MSPPTPGPEPHGHRIGQRKAHAGRDVIGNIGNQDNRQHHVHHHGAVVPTALFGAPAPPEHFTGRDRDLAELLDRLDPRDGEQAVVVSALSGMGGVGKTALAAKAAATAHERRWFCALLWVDLHGYTPDAQPVTAEAALDTLLRAMGVDPGDIPPMLEERAAFYRSALQALSHNDEGGRPVLVVADNARDAAQVRPLLPGPGGHRLVVTARGGLHSLAGARHLDLDVLAAEEAVALLATELNSHTPDDQRSRDEEGLGRLAKCCGYLPLALDITAGQLKRDPYLTPDQLVERLTRTSSRLEGLKDRERAVHTVFETSVADLADTEARVLLLLGVAPGPTTSTLAVAVLADLEVVQAEEVLTDLAEASLIARPAPGRWAMHDLVADYARHHSAPLADRDQAVERLLDVYAVLADAADDHLRALPSDEVPELFTGREEALAWLDAEYPSLIEAVRAAQSTGYTDIAIELPLILAEYLDLRRRFAEWEEVTRIALTAAQTVGDERGEAMGWNNLGNALRHVRRFEEAIDAHTRARDLRQREGDAHGEASSWNNLGNALQQVRRFEEAIDAHTRARDLHQRVGDAYGEATAWNNLGTALRQVRRFEEAIDAHRHDLAYCRRVGDAHGEAMAWNNLGTALWEVRRFEEAVTAFERAVRGFRDTDDAHSLASTGRNLARLRQRPRWWRFWKRSG